MARLAPSVPRWSRFVICVAALITSATGEFRAQSPQQPIVDPNVNMVRGFTLADGDPYLQRQNEPSIAVSTRNPCHLLGGANDYRAVDVPFDDTPIAPNGEPNISLAGDAWLGLFKSFDCGQKWVSTLLPGYPQDKSGKALELKGHEAGADPTVRAGHNGLFYYSGMVFNRGEQGESKIFVARLIDNNNKERGDPIEFLDVATIDTGTKGQFLDKPWLAVDVPRNSFGPGSTLASGTTSASGSCTVNGRDVPAGNVYMAWARFTGNSSQHSKLMFARSEDCGKTWKTNPVSTNQTLSQGANIAVAPHDGTIYLTWREFAGNNKPVNIWVAVSSDGGKNFSNPKIIAGDVKTFDQIKSGTKFRSNALPAITADHQDRVYIAWSATGYAWAYGAQGVKAPNGDARIVMTVSSNRGQTFSPVFMIDPNLPENPADTKLRRGHQMMPSLAFAAGKIQAIYYDAREDLSAVFQNFIDDKDVKPGKLRHTIDVRGAQANPAPEPVFVVVGSDSLEISKYRRMMADVKDAAGNVTRASIEVGANPPNLPMYAAGSMPFMGDYIDVSGLAAFPIQTAGGQQVWQPNIGPLDWAIGAGSLTTSTKGFPMLPVFHAAWTDNRDVKRVDPSVCTVDPKATGERNANIYTSRLTPGLYVGSPGNTKPLGARLHPVTKQPTDELIQRGFVVFAQNTTDQQKFYQFTIASQPVGGRASFRQFDTPTNVSPGVPPGPSVPLDKVIVGIPKGSTAARTVYATSTDVNAQILVNIEEVAKAGSAWVPMASGLRGSILLNPDRTNPKIEDPDLDDPSDPAVPKIATDEVHDPSMFEARFYKYPKGTASRMLDVKNPDPENPDPENPDPENPDPENPDPENPDPENPDPENPDPENTDLINPDPENPDPENPDPENPDPENVALLNTAPDVDPANSTITDIAWRVHNAGNTTSAYRFRPSIAKKVTGAKYQLIVTRRYMVPTMATYTKDGQVFCQPVYKSQNQVLVNIENFQPRTPDPENPDPENPDPENPDPENPDPENANFFLQPDETATVTLRVFTPGDESNPDIPDSEEEVAGKTAAKAANTGDTLPATVSTNADLTVVDPAPTFAPGIVRPGRIIDVTFTVANRGTRDAAAPGGIKSRVYFSTDAVLSADDAQIGVTRTVDRTLPFCDDESLADCDETFVHQVPMPTTPGQYTVFVVTDNDNGAAPEGSPDPEGEVFEGDEINNVARIPVTVVPFELAFLDQPRSTTQDFTMSTAVTVLVTHDDQLLPPPHTGGPVTGTEVPSVSLAIASNPSGGVLSGTRIRDNSAGVVSFEHIPALNVFGLRIDQPGNGYTLSASAALVDGAISTPFNIEVDQPPVVGNDSYTVAEDQTLAVPAPGVMGVLGNDSDPAFEGIKPAANNPRPSPGCPPGFCIDAMLLTGPLNGQLISGLGLDGAFSYQPDPSFVGTDTFTYRARDGRAGNETTGTVTITVTAVNDAPSFTKGADQTVAEDAGAQSVPGWATAISPGPANESTQTVDFPVSNDNNALFSSQPAVSSNGTLTYTPAANANGTAIVTVRAHDNGGTAGGGVDISAPQAFAIVVNAVNDPPSFTKGADQTAAEDAGAQSIANFATNISRGPADESGQSLTFIVLNPGNPSLFSVQPAIAADGTLSYTPAPDANGTANLLVQLQDDGGGTNLSAPANFNITIAAVNDTPSFTKGANQVVGEDAPAQAVPGWATAISAGPANEAGQAIDFIVTNDHNTLFATQPAVSANGTLSYAPAANRNGVATVTVQVHDNGGGADTSVPQTFTIEVTGDNDPPLAAPDSYTVNEDVTLMALAAVGVLANDTDADAGTSLSAVKVSDPSNGTLTLNANGSFTYAPNAHFFGTDAFTYRANDGSANSNVVTVSLTVNAVNDAPSFTKGADQIAPEGNVAQTVPGWATAISAGPGNEAAQAIDFIVTNDSSNLFNVAPAVSATGTLTFTPKQNQTGTATVTVRAHDSGGTANGGVDTSAAQTFTITISDAIQNFVVTNTADSGAGSLRAAILNANANASPDVISFNIPGGGGRTITPLTPLPAIVFPVVINATTQPGFSGTPLVELNGSSAGAGATGLTLQGNNITIRGFVINRFAGGGIHVLGANNLIAGNFIGTNSAGSAALGNGVNGIAVQGAPNTIGGNTAADRNIVSGNGDRGILVSNALVAGNVIKGNYIGTNAAGDAAVPNVNAGVFIEGSNSTRVGGNGAGDGNLISGNMYGVVLYICAPSAPCGGHTIAGNKIGTNLAGTAAIPNRHSGVHIFHAPNNTIHGNVISGNGDNSLPLSGDGVSIQTPTLDSDPQAEQHYGNQTITGNLIGTDVTGMLPIPNLRWGIVLTGHTKARIGGVTPADRNVISYNTYTGIYIGYSTMSPNNTVQGNYIGVRANGTQPAGNGDGGIMIDLGSSGNLIGGAAAGAGNLVGANIGNGGIAIVSNQANGTVIQGNFVGTDAAGTAAIGNQGRGIHVGGTNTLVSQNRIAKNTGAGIEVGGGAGHTLSQNLIYDNGQLGIDLSPSGVNANDAGDADAGANNRQNFPAIASAFADGGSTTVMGTLASAATAAYTIEFFSSSAADPSAHGEGQSYLGSLVVNTDGSGNAGIATTLPAVAPGAFITATARDAAGNTSEFSLARVVVANSAPTASNDSATTTNNGSTTLYPGANDTDPDVASPSVLATVRAMPAGAPVLIFPGDLAIVEATGLAYFTGGGISAATPAKIGVLDTNTNTIGPTVINPSVPSGSSLVRVNQTTRIAYMRIGVSLQAIDGRPASPTFNAPILALQMGGIQSMAIDEIQSRLYVSAITSGAGTVAVSRIVIIDVDPTSPTFHQAIHEIVIPGNGNAAGVAVNPATNKAYAAFGGGTSPGVNVIDGATFAVTQVPNTAGASTVIVNDANNLIYANSGTSLFVVDGTTDTRIATLTLPASSTFGALDTRLAVHKATGHLYVRVAEFPAASRLVVVDGNRTSPTFNTIKTTLAVGREDNNTMVAVDQAANRVITTSRADLKSTVIDATTNAVIGTISATQPVTRVAIDAVHHRAYVAGGLGFVQAIDLATGTEHALIPTGVEMTFGPVSSINHTAYIPQTGLTTAVSRIDQSGLVGTVALPHGDGRMLLATKNAVTNRVYALNSNATAAGGSDAFPGFVSVIDASTNAVIANVPVGPLPFQGLAVNEAANKIYVGSSFSGTAFPSSITVIDGVTHATVQADLSQIPQQSAVPGQVSFVRDFAVNPMTNKVYLRITGGSPATMGVLNGATNVVTALPSVFGAINIHRVNPGLNRVYIAGTNAAGVNEIHVLDGDTDQVIGTVTAGSPSNFATMQSYLAVNRTTGKVFAADFLQDTLAVIDGATNTVVGTVRVGDGPSAVAVNETLNRIYVGNTHERTMMIVDGSTLSVVATIALPLAPLRLEVDETTSQVFIVSTGNEPGVMVVADPGTRAPRVTSVTQGAHGTVVLNADGSVTYTATGGYTGADSYTYTVTDDQGGFSTATVNVTSVAALAITTASLPNSTVGASYSQVIAATGGTGSKSWALSAGNLPGGLALNQTTGALSGTARQSGTFVFTIAVRDSATPHQAATQSYTVIVGPPVVTTTSLPSGFVGTPYSQVLGYGGATGDVLWTLNKHNNPRLDWLSLSSDGTLTGTPPDPGTSPSFTVTVTDSLNQAASRSLNVLINAPLDIAPPREGIVLETQPGLAFFGGNGQRTATITSGVLPPGLTLNLNGSFSGSPTRHGEFPLTLELRDCQLSTTNGLPTCNNQTTPQVVPNKTVTLRVSAKEQQGSSAPTPALPAQPLTIAFGGAGGRRVAQVVTIGAHGTLTAVGLQNFTCPAVTPVTVDVQRLTLAGLPDGTTIATGTAVANYNAIAVSPAVETAIDERFAFIVSSPVACTFTNASTFDQYNGGDAYVDPAGSWVSLRSTAPDNDPRYDIPSFRTLIQPAMDVAYLNRSRGGLTATLLDTGKVLLVSNQSASELYDPATHTSALSANTLAVQRSNHTATLLANGAVLIVGGNAFGIPPPNRTTTVEIFDPATGLFSTAAGQLALGRDRHQAVRLGDGRVLIIGGNTDTGRTAATEIYDPTTQTFSPAGSMSTAREQFTATLLESEAPPHTWKVLVTGGYTNGGGSGAEVFDPATGLFTPTTGAMMVSNRGQATATRLNDGTVLIAGGQSGDIRNEAEIYNPGTNAFTATGALGGKRYAHTATLLPDGSVLIAGGFDQQTSASYIPALATLERYVPGSAGFQPAGGMAARRSAHSAAPLPGGRVFIAGGFGQSWMTGNTGELFDPAAAALGITPATLPDATPTVGYSVTLGSMLPVTVAYDITHESGVLPSGMTYDAATRTLSGTPSATSTGVYPLAFRITKAPHTSVQTRVLQVGGINTITSPYRLTDGAVTKLYSLQLTASGATPIRWSLLPASSTPPPGLSLDPTSGVISGTPTATGYYNFGVRAVDATGQAAQKVLSISINNPLTITTTTLNDATAGDSYSGCLSRSNGVGPFTWALNGEVPPGMAFNPTNPGCFDASMPARMLRETGTFSFTATVTDSSSPPQVVPQGYTIRIHARDQSIGTQFTAAVSLPSTRRVAQVYRSSSPFDLSGVQIFNLSSCTANTLVTATVWPVTGAPARPDESGQPLAVASMTANNSGFLPSSILPFAPTVPIPQHAPFAVVVSFGPAGSSCQGANWPTSDFYAHGQGWVDDGAGWQPSTTAIGRADIPFTTLVMSDSRLTFTTAFRGFSAASATLNDGPILMVGSDNTADVYDPATHTSTRTAGNMSTARSGASASRLSDGRILIAGGSFFNGKVTEASATTEIFDPATGLFSPGAALPQGRAQHEATTLGDGRILLSGGFTYDANGFSQSLATAVLLDGTNGSVIGTANMTGARYEHSATALPDGRALILGGWTGTPFPPNTAEIYDPAGGGAAGTFTTIAVQVPGGFRSEHTATLLTTGPRAGQVLIAGGSGSYPEMATQNAFFDPATLTFSAAPGLLTPRWRHTATVLADQRILITGGETSWISFKSISAVEIYDPVTNQFETKPSLLTDRSDLTTVLLPPQFNGKVAVAGGSSSGGALSGRTVEVYDPSTTDLAITTATLPDGATGIEYPAAVVAAAGGTGAGYEFSIAWGDLPAGLSINENDGTITGTPTAAGPVTVSIKVTDSASNTAYKSFTITVDRLTITSTSPLPNGVVNVEYNHQLAANGTGALTWTLDGSNTLPTGLTLSASGLLSGTVTAPTSRFFNVRVSDATGQLTIRGFSLTFSQALAITTTSLGDGILGNTFNGCISSSGGSPPFTWALSGNIPDGLALQQNSSCFDWTYPEHALTEGGTFTFTAAVTDSSSPQQTASREYTIRVHATDQSFGGDSQTPVPVPSTRRVAQVFRSATPYPLSGVQLYNFTSCTAGTQLTATVWPVIGAPARPDQSGAPLGTASVTVDPNGFFNSMLVFAAPVAMPQHARFAIVVSIAAGGSCQGTFWPTFDWYPYGHGWVDDGAGWQASSATIGRSDVPISTLVLSDDRVTVLSSWRSQHASATLADGRVLLVGNDSTTEIYDPSTKTTTATGDMNEFRQGATATLLPDGKVFVAGGQYYNGVTTIALASTEIFDPATGTFTPAGNMSIPRSGHRATLLLNGRVLITGGQTFNGTFWSSVQAAEVFDSNGAFLGAADMTGGRSQHTATLLTCPAGNPACAWGGKVLIAGGWVGDPWTPNDAELYDPSNGPLGTFTGIASPMSATGSRAEHSATLLLTGARAGQVLIAGGNGPSQDFATTNAFYDPATETFTAAPGLNTPRWQHSAAVLSDGRVAIVGGSNSWFQWSPISAVEIYDPAAGANGTFRAMPSLVVDRVDATLDLVTAGPNAGRLVVAGGNSWSWFSGRTVELYDPSGTPVVIATGSLPDGQTGQVYSATLIGTGGTGAPYTFSLAWGQLPADLELNADGTITGTPTEGGIFSFVAKVTDSTINIGYRSFTIVVDRLVITSTSPLPNGSAPGNYSHQLTATGAGAITWTLEPGNTLPDDVTLSSTGLLSGPTPAPRSSYFNIRATDAAGQTAVRFFSLQIVGPPGGMFEALSPMSVARRGHVNEQLNNGLVLLAGSDNFLTSAELYNPNTQTTAATGSLSTGRCYGCSVAKLPDGRVLAAGGWTGAGGVLSSAEIYDQSTGTWSATGSMTTGRLGGNAVLLANGRVLILGGHNGFTPHSSAEIFDPVAGTFTATDGMGAARTGPGAVRLGDGRVLVAGGQTTGGGVTASAEIYDPNSGDFSATGGMSTPRQVNNATLLWDGRVLIAGGSNAGGPVASAEVFDPTTGTFSAVASMSTARSGHSTVLLNNGKVLVIGGLDAAGNALATAEFFDPNTNTFSPAPSLAQPRTDAGAVVLWDGRILVTGGTGAAGQRLATIEVYHP